MRRPFGILFMLLLAWSCTDDRDNRKPETYPVQFSSGLTERVATRAANDRWDAGDKVGIYMVPATANASDAANLSSGKAAMASNVPYYTPVDGTSVSLVVVSEYSPIVFPEDNSPVNFVAYYPYRADTHTTNAHIYKVNVATQSPSKEIDLLYHKGTGTPYDHSATNVPLEFTHQLGKMKINLIPADAVSVDLTDATVVLTGFPTTANFNLSTGVLDGQAGTGASLTPVKLAASAGQTDFEAIVVPHSSGSSYTRTVTFTIEGVTYSYTLPVSDAFEEGLAHNYNFKFTGGEITLAHNTIVDWGGGTVVWSDYMLTASKINFDLFGSPTSGNTLTLSTNAPSVPVWTLSEAVNINTPDKPLWITGVSLSADAPSDNGWANYTLTFGTDFNNTGAPRTGYIRLEIDGLTLVIHVTQGNAVIEPNCHMIIPDAAPITFNPTRAFTHGGAAAGARLYVTLLWQDAACISTPTVTGTGIGSVVTVTPTANAGNAGIAVRTGSATGPIVWSYHIWVTAYMGTAVWTNNGYTFMDRNLGASTASNSLTSHGLYYQWGRKDPFPGGKPGTAGFAALSSFRGMPDAGSTATAYVTNKAATPAGVTDGILEAIRNPTTFYSSNNASFYDWLPINENTLWDTSGRKSAYDPCPAGWRVPLRKDGVMSNTTNSNSPWYGVVGQTWTSDTYTDGTNWGLNALYPAAGLRDRANAACNNAGDTGYYWSASVTGYNGYSLYFYSGNVNPNDYYSRSYGLSVRCVRE